MSIDTRWRRALWLALALGIGIGWHVATTWAAASWWVPGTGWPSFTAGSVPYMSDADTLGSISPNATAVVKVMSQVSSAQPTWRVSVDMIYLNATMGGL